MNQSTLIYLKNFSLFALNSKETKHINKPYSASKQPPFHLLINRCKRENTRGGSPLIYTVFLQFSSVAQSCLTLCDPMGCSMPGLPVPYHLPGLPKFMSIESVIPSNHLILCCPLLLLPSVFPSIRVFSNESALCIKCPEYWSFSFSLYKEY